VLRLLLSERGHELLLDLYSEELADGLVGALTTGTKLGGGTFGVAFAAAAARAIAYRVSVGLTGGP
jgi:hypothetical protein